MTVGEFIYLIKADKSQLNSTLNESEKSVQKWGSKMSSWTVAKGQMIANFATKAVSKIADVGKQFAKQSIEAYSTFEQLEGGTRLLYGKAYDSVMERASHAFQNVQMSMNDYLQAVNSYATGLKTSLNGDEQAAADLADKIITAQADVVAATGAEQEAVQHAFTGLMRGNFTMLDNLQLGIKPTKEGFKELITQVNDWNKANGKATKYEMDNLADMQSALVDYIEMQGLAGYAQREAADTIQGTMASTKAAWQDLLVAFGSGKDVKKATRNFTDSAKKMLKNILPAAKNMVQSVGSFFSEIIPEAGAWFDRFAAELEKSDNPVLQAVAKVRNAIKDGFELFQGEDGGFKLPSASELWEKLKPAVESMWSVVRQSANSVLKFVFGETEDGGIDFPTPVEMWEKIKDTLVTIWDVVKTNASEILKFIFGETEDGGIAFPTPEELWEKVKSTVTAMWEGVQTAASDILKLVFGEDESGGIDFPTPEELWEKVKGTIDTLWSGVKTAASDILKLVFGEGKDGGIDFPDPETFAYKIGQKIGELWDQVKATAQTILKLVFGEGEDGGIEFPSAEEMWSKIKSALETMWNGVKILAKSVLNLVLGALKLPSVSQIKNQIETWWSNVKREISLTLGVKVETPKETSRETDSEGNTRIYYEGTDFVGYEDASGGGGGSRGFAKGLLTVPYDNFKATLHRGERVLTASQARHGDEVDYEYIGAMIGHSVESAMSRIFVALDGNKVGDFTTRRTSKNIRKREAAVLHGMGG